MTSDPKPAVVEDLRPLARDVFQLVLRPVRAGGEPFHSGQHLLLRVGEAAPRAYSIASSPRKPDRLEFAFREVGRGGVSTALAALRPGDRVVYEGPSGGFTLHSQDERRLFVATGTGIAPLRAMILDRLEAGDPTPQVLVFGNHSLEDTFYLDSFRDLAARYPQFRFLPALSHPEPSSWDGEVGRVTEVLPRILTEAVDWSAYLCGRNAMIHDATRILVDLGVPRDHCYREP